MNNVLSFGEFYIENVENATLKIKKILQTLQPTQVITDLLPGWGILSAIATRDLNIPHYSALPFKVEGKDAYNKLRDGVIKNSVSTTIFNPTMDEFIKNPQPYIDWIGLNVKSAICYVDTEDDSSFSYKLMLFLQSRDITLFNLYGG